MALLATEILLAREDCLAIAEKRIPPPESSMAPRSSNSRHQIEKPHETPRNIPPHSQVPSVKPLSNTSGVNHESFGFDPRTTESPEVFYEHAPAVSQQRNRDYSFPQPDTQSPYLSSDQSLSLIHISEPTRPY